MFYPMMVNLIGKKCVVVGGGSVAARKIRELIKCCDNIIVVSPELCKELDKLKSEGKIKWISDHYDKKYIEDAFLCFASTDDLSVNNQILKDSNSIGILVNLVDRTDGGSFIVPAVRRKDNMVITVTCHENPAASRYVADHIINYMEPWMEEYISLTSHLRKSCRKSIGNTNARQSYMKSLFSEDFIKLAKEDIEQAKIKAEEILAKLASGEGE